MPGPRHVGAAEQLDVTNIITRVVAPNRAPSLPLNNRKTTITVALSPTLTWCSYSLLIQSSG